MSRREVITCDACGQEQKSTDDITNFKIEYHGMMVEYADACLDCQAKAQLLMRAFFDKTDWWEEFRQLSKEEAKANLKRLGIISQGRN